MGRMRVLVCGSNYGRAYVTALAREPRKYQLAGILARGSLRSRRLAALNGVPLYCSTNELPDNIQLACAAMSSTAFPVVLELLRRGIHVLCEHPYPANAMKQALDLARKRGVQFHVNGHFVNLPAPRIFISECQRALKLTRPEFVEVMATERSLYGALDVLMAAMGSGPQHLKIGNRRALRLEPAAMGRQPLRVRVLSRRARFVLLEGTLGKIPLRVSVQVSGKGRSRLADGSPDYQLDQRLTVAFPAGLLTLLSAAGPVFWNRTAAQAQGQRAPQFQREGPLWTVLSGQETQTLPELGEQRIQANVTMLNSIRQSILGRATPETQQPQHILQVSRAWEATGRQLY